MNVVKNNNERSKIQFVKTYTFEVLKFENEEVQKKVATIIYDSNLPEDKVLPEVTNLFNNPVVALKLINIKEKKEAGRPKAINFNDVQEYKSRGFTQEEIARQMKVSLSTVRRNWDIRKKLH
ncbi:ECF-type sigma factor [Acetivibrio cellulolyticus]|uniref:ECF-type sigma factor n=1 Tax=Acetivibrio cellulolyticus TaxID=35830 RepID=UPI0001E2C79C|nr:ECF-type sigma factor [Acetivibrio cellulolyticus]